MLLACLLAALALANSDWAYCGEEALLRALGKSEGAGSLLLS